MPGKFKTFGYKEWQVATSPKRFAAVLKKHMERATELNGMVAAKAQRKVIQESDGIAKNAPLTVFIKGSSKPLVDYADLFGSITYQVINEFTVFAGVLRQNEDDFNVAVALHEGFVTAVTPQMRGMFLYLWKASKGEIDPSKLTGRAAELWKRRPGTGWLPLSDDTTAITTPGRPWATIAFHESGFKAKVRENWEQALDAVFAELAGKPRTTKSKAERMVAKAAKHVKRWSRVAAKAEKSANRLSRKAGKALSRASKKTTKMAKRTSKLVSKRVRSVKRSISKRFK